MIQQVLTKGKHLHDPCRNSLFVTWLGWGKWSATLTGGNKVDKGYHCAFRKVMCHPPETELLMRWSFICCPITNTNKRIWWIIEKWGGAPPWTQVTQAMQQWLKIYLCITVHLKWINLNVNTPSLMLEILAELHKWLLLVTASFSAQSTLPGLLPHFSAHLGAGLW